MTVKVPVTKLYNGIEMPIIGLGTYSRAAEPGQFRQAVEWGLQVGYRHIDTASSYYNEEEVGEGIANKVKEGLVTREELFITTKLWNDHHARDEVVSALKESLQKLDLDYVDLYLIHWPFSVNKNGEDAAIDYLETWKGMEEAVRLGLTKSIGVSNFNEQQLRRLLNKAQIKPVVNQIEISPTLTQHALVSWCLKNEIAPVAYTPLGLLSDARPEFAGKDTIKSDPHLASISEKYGKTRAQIALRYLIQRGVTVIPKSFTKSRLEENLNIFDFELTEQEIAIIDGFNIDHRCVPALKFKDLSNYPF